MRGTREGLGLWGRIVFLIASGGVGVVVGYYQVWVLVSVVLNR